MNMHVNFMADAQAALGFLRSQTAHIETAVNMARMPDIQYPLLIPIDTSASPWIKSVTYYSGDIYGAAKWINANADDIPIAGSERTKHETMVHSAGIGYGYGLEELRQAQMLGINLTSDDAMAARRAYEEFMERLMLTGDASKNFKGLINNSLVTAVTAQQGDWGGTGSTVGGVMGDINQALLAPYNDTLQTSIPNTLLLSTGKLAFLGATMLDGTNVSLLSYILQNNIYTMLTGQPLLIRAIRGLETAGVGPSERMVAYRRDAEVLKAHVPMPHTFLPVWQSGPTRFDVPGIFRTGGLDVRRPKEMRYVDGI